MENGYLTHFDLQALRSEIKVLSHTVLDLVFLIEAQNLISERDLRQLRERVSTQNERLISLLSKD